MRMMENALMLITKSSSNCKTIITHPGMFLASDKTNRYKADYISVVGEFIKKELLEIGYTEKRIITNGDPQFDDYSDKNYLSKENFYNKLNLNFEKKIVLLISDRINPTLSYEEKREQFQLVSQVVAKYKDLQLVVKPHPTENISNIRQDLRRWGLKNAIISDNNSIELFEILSFSSLVVIAWSMVGFEAMLFGVPVVVVNLSKKDYDFQIPFVKKGGASLAKSDKQLETIINNLIFDKNHQMENQITKGYEFCSKYYRLPLGGASKRVFDLITKSSKAKI
jgi:UDP-N-acetylglucosamine 2-epimerase